MTERQSPAPVNANAPRGASPEPSAEPAERVDAAAADGGDAGVQIDAAAAAGAAGAARAAAGSGGSRAEPAADSGAAAGAGGCSAQQDCCPEDTQKLAPGVCGCGVRDADSDGDGVPDCVDPAPHGWLRKLGVDHAQVAADISDFPLLVRITDAHLGTFAAADGSDIHFLAADRRGPLPHELERFDARSGELTAWVLAPSLGAKTDTVLYLGYADAKPDRSQPAAVWRGHQHVWHLAQDPGGSGAAIQDATGRAHGTAQGGMGADSSLPAVAGRGLQFDGVDDCIAFANDFTGSGPSTLEGWVNQSEQSTGLGSAVVSFGNQQDNQARFLFSHDVVAGAGKVGFYGNDVIGAPLSTGSWHHLAWVWDGENSRQYVDGALVVGPTAHAGARTAGTAGFIGSSTFRSPAYEFFMRGMLDEVRVSSAARASAWISTEYNNQKPGSTFLQLGDPEPAP